MKVLRQTLVAAAVLLAAGASTAAPIVVSFTPSAQHVAVGGTVTLEMWITGLGSEILSAFDFNVRYNAALLGLNLIDDSSVIGQLGGNWGAVPLVLWDSMTNGDLGVIGDSLYDDEAVVASNQADSFLIARFELTGTTDGMTMFGLGPDLDFERNFLGRNYGTLDITVQAACVAVGQAECRQRVPEPASYGLAGLALLGLALRKRSR